MTSSGWRSLVLRSVVALALVAASGCGRRSAITVSDPPPATTPTSVATSSSNSTNGSTTAATAAATTTATVPGPVVVGLGNSVPSGSACSCVNFVSAYAAMVAAGKNAKATVDNDAVSGSTSADVVNQLSHAGSVQAHVRAATTVLIMTGANDFNDAFDAVSLGAPATTMFPPVATAVQDNVTAVVQRIQALNRNAHVVVLDYWAAMEDGAVAAKDYDAPTMAASLASTNYVNDALAVAAKATGALYVSTYTAFKGPSGANDPTGLLAADGDHPNASGHQLIARTIFTVLPSG